MKKFFALLSVVATLFVVSSVQAQTQVTTPVFGKGDNIASLTVGYGWGFSQRLVYEHAVASWLDNRLTVGVGAAAGNSFRFWSDGDISDRFYIGAVASCHYQFIDKLDTYVQIGTGMVSRLGYRGSYGLIGVDFTSSLGARWYFNDNFAVNAEAGYTTDAYLMAGVTYKF